MTSPTKQHGSDAQRASDANRQTSERERLAEWLERWATEMDMGRKPDVKDKHRIAADQLRADERLDAEIAALRTELARLRLTHTETAANLAAADEQVHATDEIIAALRAENDALRTVTNESISASLSANCGYGNRVRSLFAEDLCQSDIFEAMRAALQSFIRSKESRRG